MTTCTLKLPAIVHACRVYVGFQLEKGRLCIKLQCIQLDQPVQKLIGIVACRCSYDHKSIVLAEVCITLVGHNQGNKRRSFLFVPFESPIYWLTRVSFELTLTLHVNRCDTSFVTPNLLHGSGRSICMHGCHNIRATGAAPPPPVSLRLLNPQPLTRSPVMW